MSKKEFIEILDQRLDQKIGKKIDEKLDEFAVMVRNSFQRIEDRMATKEELRLLESRMDKRFNKLDRKIEIYQGSTNRRFNWFTNE